MKEKKRGLWKKQYEEQYYHYVCSECGSEIPKNKYGHDWFSGFCPGCGKPMDTELEVES